MKKVLLSMLALSASAAMVAQVQNYSAPEVTLNTNMDVAKSMPAKSNVKADPQKVAYDFPKGTFHFAPIGGSVYPYAMLPAKVPVTWENVSTGFTEADVFEWTYFDIQDKPVIVEGTNLELTYPVSMTNTPILKCGDMQFSISFVGNDGNTHSYGLTPGLCPSEVGLDGGRVCKYSQFIGDMQMSLFYLYSTGGKNLAGAEKEWKETFSQVHKMELTSAKTIAFSTVLEQTPAPYVLKDVLVTVMMQSNADTKLKMSVYKGVVNSEGAMERGDMLTSTEIDVPLMGARGQVELVFPISGPVDPITGLQADFLKVDTPLILELSGFADNAALDDFSMVTICNELNYLKATGDFSGMTTLQVVDATGTSAQVDVPMPEGWVYQLDDKRPDVRFRPNHFYWAFDAYYPFFNVYTAEGAYTESWTAPNEGGSVKFLAESNDNDPAAWFVTDAEGNDLPSWLKAELGTQTMQGSSGTYEMATIALTAEALPSGVTGRSAVVKVMAAMGGVGEIKVVQGEGGVDAVIAEEIGVAVVGEDFVVKANTEVSSVEIYNLAGQLVKSAELSAGNNVIAAGDLAKGVYVLHFNNNATVKAVK